MLSHKFSATLEKPDVAGAWTFLCVPLNVEDVFGARARVAVKGNVNGVVFPLSDWLVVSLE